MEYQFTPAAERALRHAAAWLGRDDCSECGGPALLLGLLAQPECRAAIMLARCRIDAAAVRARWPRFAKPEVVVSGDIEPLFGTSFALKLFFHAAAERLPSHPWPPAVATEHLLLALAAAEDETAAWLREQGLDPRGLEAEVHQLYGDPTEASPLDFEDAERPALEAGKVESHIWRILDAAANRAREGLRVVEDYVRFALDDRHLTEQCKRLRHDLAAALGRLPPDACLAARETQADVGTTLTTPSEQHRAGASGVLAANFSRLEESLRTLEEFGKLLDTAMASSMEQLRYRAYTLQRAVELTRRGLARLATTRLCVLLGGCCSAEQLGRLAHALIAAGADVLQLRDKRPDDRRLLERARLLREMTAGTATLLIVNDRPDVARLACADGVHLGQTDLAVKDARAMVGPEALIGVSTHSIQQARQAVLDGADYLGVGPTFASGTKQFEEFPGLALLRAVAAEVRLPTFAIGGIQQGNLAEVLASGIRRVAVGGAISSAADPAAVVREMLAAMEEG